MKISSVRFGTSYILQVYKFHPIDAKKTLTHWKILSCGGRRDLVCCRNFAAQSHVAQQYE